MCYVKNNKVKKKETKTWLNSEAGKLSHRKKNRENMGVVLVTFEN